jgi:hypothetical protein
MDSAGQFRVWIAGFSSNGNHGAISRRLESDRKSNSARSSCDKNLLSGE